MSRTVKSEILGVVYNSITMTYVLAISSKQSININCYQNIAQMKKYFEQVLSNGIDEI